MANIEKTVFISYRRKDIAWALAVYHYLTKHDYDVFFDFTSIPSGDFEQSIIGNIKARAHFLVIMTPSSLDRCSESGDWLRREIVTALSEKRNIIPLFFDGFNFGAPSVSEKLTGDLATLEKYNGIDVPLAYFDAAMERLRNKYLNVALDAVLHPVSSEAQKVVEKQKVAADGAIRNATHNFNSRVRLPSTISIETLGGVSTPVFSNGLLLPAKGSFIYSTASDNQTQVEIHLVFGENKIAKDNVSLGKYIFAEIPPAPRGVPQIEIEFEITTNLILSIRATDKATGRSNQLGKISLDKIAPPLIKDPLHPKIYDSSLEELFGGSSNDGFSEFFKTIFGAHTPNATSEKKEKTYEQENDIEISLTLSFEEAAFGTTKDIEFYRYEKCSDCNGSGIRVSLPCKKCESKGKSLGKFRINVRVPPGVSMGSKIRFAGVGHIRQDGSLGNVYSIVSVEKHPFFTRTYSDLYIRYPISKRLAVQGGNILVPLLEKGSKVRLVIPANTKNNQKFKVANRGIPKLKNPSQHGDLYVTVEIYDPKNISQDVRTALTLINKQLNNS